MGTQCGLVHGSVYLHNDHSVAPKWHERNKQVERCVPNPCIWTVPSVFVLGCPIAISTEKIDEEWCQISEAQVVLDRFAKFCLLCDWKVAHGRYSRVLHVSKYIEENTGTCLVQHCRLASAITI